VKERQHTDHHVVVPDAHTRRLALHEVRHQVAMREHYPLRNPGRATGVRQGTDVGGRVDLHHWRHVAKPEQTRVGRGVGDVTEHHDLTDRTCQPCRSRALLEQIGDGEEHHGFTVGELCPDLFGRGDRVHGTAYGSEHRDGVEHHRKVRQVGTHQPHDIAFSNALGV